MSKAKKQRKTTEWAKARALFKKIGDTRGTFHARMGVIKDRYGKDLTEAEEIKKRWQEQTEELYNKGLNDTDNQDGVLTYLEPDMLKCEVKWALGSITLDKASGTDGIPAELFEILKDDAVKVLHSICQQIWKTQQWPRDWKRSVFIPVPKKGNAPPKGNANKCSSEVKVTQLCLTLATPWTVQSVDFSRPEYWSAQPFPSPGDLLYPGIELRSPTLQVDSLPVEPQGKPKQITINCKVLKEMGVLDHLTCLLRNLYASLKATVRIGHGTMDWFKTGKGL